MMLCGIFLFFMLWSSDGARLAGEKKSAFILKCDGFTKKNL